MEVYPVGPYLMIASVWLVLIKKDLHLIIIIVQHLQEQAGSDFPQLILVKMGID